MCVNCVVTPILNSLQEEPKKVLFNYDLFLNLEGNPPVNHLRCEKLTFNNPTEEFRRKLLKAGGVMYTRFICIVPATEFCGMNRTEIRNKGLKQ